MKARILNTDNFDATIRGSDEPVLVDFWAEWCPPCRILGPVIDQIADEQNGRSLVAKVDVDESQELAQRYGIQSIPTLIVFKRGQPVERLQGAQSKQRIEQALAAAG